MANRTRLSCCGVYETPLGLMTLAVPFLLEGLQEKTTSDDVLRYEACYDERIARRFPVSTLCTSDARKMPGLKSLMH